MSYLLFFPLGADDPVGALPIPECFAPNLILIHRARDMGLTIGLAEAEEAPPALLVAEAEKIMHHIHMAATN